MRQEFFSHCIFYLLIPVFFIACNSSDRKNPENLYSSHCGSCHLAPDINSLPKHIWANNILPDMAARMGIKEGDYNPYKGYTFLEMEAAMLTGIYTVPPLLSQEEWTSLKEYIIALAPEELQPLPDVVYDSLDGFKIKRLDLDSIPGSMDITYLKHHQSSNQLIYGNLAGSVHSYDWEQQKTRPLANFRYPVVSYEGINGQYVTTIGLLNPTQIEKGEIFRRQDDSFIPFGGTLHRPVHSLVKDLDQDGLEEIVICEFGDLAGKLSLFTTTDGKEFKKRILLNQPGAIRTIARDMNGDNLDDLVVLSAQGDEGITIFYQGESLSFEAEKVLRFSPVYGTSWFDLIDYEGDGDLDIITANGDNADKSYVQKPYHGFRIFLNNGDNEYAEAFFYPMHGATRVVGKDFDQDGDMDFCILATFPDYEKSPLLPFTYLKNDNPDTFSFSKQLLNRPSDGRWLLMDTGDFDNDGDEDIVLSPFTYIFTPVPDSLNTYWREKGPDMLLLDNQLIENE